MHRRLSTLGALAAALVSSAISTLAAAQPAPPPPVSTAAPPPPVSTAAPPPSDSSAAPSPPAAREGAPAASDRADELFARANEAFDGGKLDEAYALYQEAWALKRTFDIAGNLGQVELKLGKFRDAAEHLDFTLRLFPPTGKAAPREAIRRAFDAARKEVVALTIKVNVQGAAVAIDGTPIGLSPFEAQVFVDPGKRTVEATLEAHLPTRITIDVAKSESRDVELSLVPKNQPPPPPRNMTLLLSGFALSLAAAGTGVGLMIGASDKGTEADALRQTLVTNEPDGLCPCGSAGDRARLKGLRQDHDLFFNAAVGMFAGAGVLALGAAAYALTPSFQRPHASGARIVPVVSSAGGGALLVGSF